MNPPLLSAKHARRVLAVARFDGLCVLVLSGGFALISAAQRDIPGALIGLLVAGAGAIELHGVSLLRHGAASGMRWLVMSQFYLMATILAYVGWRLARPDVSWILPFVTGDAGEPIKELAAQQGMTVEQMLVTSMKTFYYLAGLLTIVFQGCMALYYIRRTKAVVDSLEEEEPL
jgi:hypothetical protein